MFSNDPETISWCAFLGLGLSEGLQEIHVVGCLVLLALVSRFMSLR